MEIEYLLSFKTHADVQNFNLIITESENNSFKNHSYRYDKNKYYPKKLPAKKEGLQITIGNKFNLILNKLSETNFNNIITEFIENINYLTVDEYDEFQRVVYCKILSEINYINLYLRFLELVGYVYNHVLDYNLNYLINIIDIKFKFDYLNEEINNDKYNFLIELNRINNIVLIKNLYNYELISQESYNFYENTLLSDKNIFISDIYYWKPVINELNISKLKIILSNTKVIRDKILIENLLNNDNKTELDYVLEEYLVSKDKDNIIKYIHNNCVDSISKTNLCKKIIEKIVNNTELLLDLLKFLINPDSKLLNKIDLTNSYKLIKIDINHIINYFD
jgi:hypothetical protein